MLCYCGCGREAEFIHANGNSRYPLCPECFLRWKELVPGAIEQAIEWGRTFEKLVITDSGTDKHKW